MTNFGLIEMLVILAVCLLTLVIMGLLFYFLYRLMRTAKRAAPDLKGCANCGRSMPADAIYCPYCGREVSSPPAENPVP